MKRKAQGAIEYLFMIAAALIIVAIVIRYLRGSSSTAGETINSTKQQLNQSLSELNQTG